MRSEEGMIRREVAEIARRELAEMMRRENQVEVVETEKRADKQTRAEENSPLPSM